MAYEFKNLNEVERQDAPTENTTVMAFEAGQPKQIPAGEFGRKWLVVDLRGYSTSEGTPTIGDMSYDPIYEAITAGQNVVFQMQLQGNDAFMQVIGCVVIPGTGIAAITFESDILFTNGSYHTTA